MSKGTAQEFVNKILWEGGLHGAADYGLKAEDYNLPVNVITPWQDFVMATQVADTLATRFTQVAKFAGLELE